MAPSATSQKAALQQFIGMTGTTERSAQRVRSGTSLRQLRLEVMRANPDDSISRMPTTGWMLLSISKSDHLFFSCLVCCRMKGEVKHKRYLCGNVPVLTVYFCLPRAGG